MSVIQDLILKIKYPYNIIISFIIILVIIYYKFNKKNVETTVAKVESQHYNINNLIIIMVLISLCFLVGYFIYDHFYFPKASENELVVAISPFNLIDEYGKTFDDINTRDEFKEKLEENKGLGVKIKILDSKILNDDDAKFYGEKVGAHLVLYGESKNLRGKREEIKYNIFTLPSLKSTKSEIGTMGIENEMMGKTTYSTVTDEPIVIIESIKEKVSSTIYLIGAFEQYKKSNFTSALTLFKSIKNFENLSSIPFYIANCYYINNDLNSSLQYLDKSININPQFAVAWNNKVIVLVRLGRYEEALATSDKSININPQNADSWNNKGSVLDQLGRYEEALAAYDKSIAINPQDAENRYNKGLILYEMGRYEEALAAYDKAIGINPQLADAWNNKGNTLLILGRYEEALAAFDKAIGINPQLANASNNKGVTLVKMGRYEEALAACDNAIGINPQLAEVWITKGNTLYTLGRYEEALGAFDKAIGINPLDADTWYNKGVILGNLDRYEEALAAFDKAIGINPQDANAWYNKGNALNNLGRYDEALGAFDKAIGINPQDADTWNNKGVTLVNMGKYEESRIAFETAYKLTVSPNQNEHIDSSLS